MDAFDHLATGDLDQNRIRHARTLVIAGIRRYRVHPGSQSRHLAMRGYFAVGVDGISKPMNLGNLMRTANAFGASFFFTINARVKLSEAQSDTSRTEGAIPLYAYANAEEFRLPSGCRLVGVEITNDAVELPRFRHPIRADYGLGADRMPLLSQVLGGCEFVVKIRPGFSIIFGTAGPNGLYDRLNRPGGHSSRPIAPGGALPEIPPDHKWGAPIVRSRK